MDLKQLNALVAVADHASFSAAARALHTVQSNVSTHVARLERELGVTLVNRNGGSLTEEGEVVAARARRIQHELEALTADVATIRDEVTGSVTVGMIGSTARWLAPYLLEAVSAAHPKVGLVLHDVATSAQIPQLVTGQIEVGLLALPVNDPDVTSEPLFEEDSVLIVPGDHQLAGKETIEITELAGHELLLLPRGTSFRDALDEAATAVGIELLAKAEVDGMRLVASMAFQGFGAAIAPASAAPAEATGNWHTISVVGLPRRSVGLALRKRSLPSAPSRAFVEVLRQVVADRAADQPAIHLALEPGADR